MATITSADVNTAIEAYETAMIARDFKAARIELLTARGLIVGLPDVTGQDSASIKYGREDIDKLLDDLRALETEAAVSATGKQWFRTQHVRPGKPQDILGRTRECR